MDDRYVVAVWDKALTCYRIISVKTYAYKRTAVKVLRNFYGNVPGVRVLTVAACVAALDAPTGQRVPLP